MRYNVACKKECTMAVVYTPEQLNEMSRETLVQMILSQQEQLKKMDEKLQLILEQLAVRNSRSFGRSSEKLETEGQLSFNINGEIVMLFNEAEALAEKEAGDEPDAESKRGQKRKGKRAADISGLPKNIISHELTGEELREIYGDENWKRLPDFVFSRYNFTPAKIGIDEHHVAVYSGVKSEKMVKAPHPAYLLRNSLVSPTVLAAIINGKYVNAMPYDRIAKEFQRQKMPITSQNMASWTIRCTERYLYPVYDYLHKKIYEYHVIQADETPCLVNKDGRPAGAKSYMWVYRTGEMSRGGRLILYQYQKTRNASHPREFLKDFSGICVTDGYQVYHTIEKEREDLLIAGCWTHARRRFSEALKAMPKEQQSGSIANLALKQIQAIYNEEGKLSDLPARERLELRRRIIKPMVEAYFAWAKQKLDSVLPKSKTWNGLSYSINQEIYLKRFLDDGEVPIDNNAAEQSIRSFCIGKKNWVMIDTVNGAESSAVIYSLTETAKANGLKPYEYIKHLLEEIPQHMDESKDALDACLEDLLPWSDKLPDECRKTE